MYHFVASCAPDPLTLSERVQVPGHIRQYLREFQLEALLYLYKHFARRDFCILNDESGLGKCVTATVFLGAIAKQKRCLIVVQNADEFVTSWQFHLSVLTNLSVANLEANKYILDPVPNITVAKWATLRAIGDISKYNFEFIIIDNRGQMLSNNFCMSMLLHNYEQKVNLLISSVDVTSDLKLLHNILRLGGRLEHQFAQFKAFEAKYKLPNCKEGLSKQINLEEYFLRREMLSNYCKEFRLRRYCHQYEDQLPFVDVDRYQISLDLWRTIGCSGNANDDAHSQTPTEELFQNELALNSEISRIVETQQSHVAASDKDNVSEEFLVMSPLLVDSESCTSEEVEPLPPLPPKQTKKRIQHETQSDVYEFIDLSTEEYIPGYNSDTGKKNKNQQDQIQNAETNDNSIEIHIPNIRSHENQEQVENNAEILQKPSTNKNDCEKIVNQNEKHKNLKEKIIEKDNNLKQKENEKTPQRVTRSTAKNDINVGRRTKSKAKSIENQKKYILIKNKDIEQNRNHNGTPVRRLRRTKVELTEPKISATKTKNVEKENVDLAIKKRKTTEKETSTKEPKRMNQLDKVKKDIPTTRSDSQVNTTNKKTIMKNQENEEINGKVSVNESTPKRGKGKVRQKKHHEDLPSLVHNTRSMQRTTRLSESARMSKYMSSLSLLRTDRKARKLKKAATKCEEKNSTRNCKENRESSCDRNIKKDANKKDETTKTTKNDNTQKDKLNELSILSFSDYDEMQCGQKLVSNTNIEKNIRNDFLVPPTPPRLIRPVESNRVYLPTPNSFIESDVIYVPSSVMNSKNQNVVVISSSPDEGSLSSQSSQSRRTRALKQNRTVKTVSTSAEHQGERRLPTFGELLGKQQRKEQEQMQRKSPDIFTASTDLGLTCTQQPAPSLNHQQRSDTFQGFKIFGSEVKQFQQKHALTSAIPPTKQTRNRSCLNILEKMFEPSSDQGDHISANVVDNSTTKLMTAQTKQPHLEYQQQQQQQRTSAVNPAKRSTRSKPTVMPTLPNGGASVLIVQDTEEVPKKHNKATMTTEARQQIVEEEIFEITNNEAFGSLMRVNSNGEISPVQSGRSTQNGQHNKITNYLTQKMPTETQMEIGERVRDSDSQNKQRAPQQLSGNVGTAMTAVTIRRSPKTKTTQTTKLTKWFQKNGADTAKEIYMHAIKKRFVSPTKESTLPSTSTSAAAAAAQKQTRSTASKQLKRRRLDLSFKN